MSPLRLQEALDLLPLINLLSKHPAPMPCVVNSGWRACVLGGSEWQRAPTACLGCKQRDSLPSFFSSTQPSLAFSQALLQKRGSLGSFLSKDLTNPKKLSSVTVFTTYHVLFFSFHPTSELGLTSPTSQTCLLYPAAAAPAATRSRHRSSKASAALRASARGT